VQRKQALEQEGRLLIQSALDGRGPFGSCEGNGARSRASSRGTFGGFLATGRFLRSFVQRLHKGFVCIEGTIPLARLEFRNALGDAPIHNRLRLKNELPVLRPCFEHVADIDADLFAYVLRNHDLVFVFYGNDRLGDYYNSLTNRVQRQELDAQNV